MTSRALFRFVLPLMAATTLAAGFAAAEERIFKTVNEEGNVVFSDMPPAPDEPSQVVEPIVNTYSSALPEDAGAVDGGDDDEDAPPRAGSYRSLAIVAPAHDAAVRNNAGNIAVVANVEPGLRPGHRLRLLLDGAPLPAPADAGVFRLQSVDRGTHSVRVQVVDGDERVVMESPAIVFHLQRHSILHAAPVSGSSGFKGGGFPSFGNRRGD